ncbi:MAG: hypothetical protein JRE23_05695 [Deltaproteobacteria bacterium]|nr:hypothetical protein [Deltaproteobacteria bacterium]
MLDVRGQKIDVRKIIYKRFNQASGKKKLVDQAARTAGKGRQGSTKKCMPPLSTRW